MVEKNKNILPLYQTCNPNDQLIDPEIVAYVFWGIDDDVLNYLAFRFYIDFHDRASNHLPLFSMSKKKLETVLDSNAYFLRKGGGMI